MEAMYAAIGALLGLVFLELLKAAITRSRDDAIRRQAADKLREEKLETCLERVDRLTSERDEWREKYYRTFEGGR